ncbi:LysR family transcriptional regulator [Levilactobacillus acidifarinae]|uniref:Transcriptional regulator, LysR family n=1 Tax=Levilactobacillus acidifarinae DSM 19394 = JCM 15949 TaxID=1423715 RepID=A0A0R1LIY3_9LACO|nr:LysR family transcriptional regulator [Levilactobacillus acidifarinae]KRK95916.1 transcriptional regulator, LysR family [Levilactobacillus acidifarinae DSM 19394]GEO69217.1 LysR family transcriptional regulator [Levilactobacillus acidifarinae]
MEFRVLQYFIAIVANKSITGAAKQLHISQSTLSRQIMDLEEELGVTLFSRGSRRITLTEDGVFLYERAKEINSLMESTASALEKGATLTGTLNVGAGEGKANQWVTQTFRQLIDEGENVTINFRSQDADQITQRVDAGVLDFGIISTTAGLDKYNTLTLPFENYWGVVMPKDNPLAQRNSLVAADLKHKKLLLPQQMDVNSQLISYLDEYVVTYEIVGTYDMNYNMRALVSSGVGLALTFDKPEYDSGDYAFRRLQYLDPVPSILIWRKDRQMTRLAEEFLKRLTALKEDL